MRPQSGHRLRLEAVAEAEMGVYVRLVGECSLELLAELSDVHVDRAVGFAEGLSPDLGVELLAADDPPAAAGERCQQLKLADSEPERTAGGQRHVLLGPDLQAAHAKDVAVGRHSHPSDLATPTGKARYFRVDGL